MAALCMRQDQSLRKMHKLAIRQRALFARAGDFLSGPPCRSQGYTCAFPLVWGDAGGPVAVLLCRSPGRSLQPPLPVVTVATPGMAGLMASDGYRLPRGVAGAAGTRGGGGRGSPVG